MKTKILSKSIAKPKAVEIIKHKVGQWVERPRKSEIFLCTCGNKYIKTRKNQVVCIRCISLEK